MENLISPEAAFLILFAGSLSLLAGILLILKGNLLRRFIGFSCLLGGSLSVYQAFLFLISKH